MTMNLTKRVRAVVRARVEAMPYPWDNPEYEEPGTLRGFFENTWQGSHADEVFEAAADVAARAAIAEVLDAMGEPSGGMLDAALVIVGPATKERWQAMLAQFKAENVG